MFQEVLEYLMSEMGGGSNLFNAKIRYSLSFREFQLVHWQKLPI